MDQYKPARLSVEIECELVYLTDSNAAEHSVSTDSCTLFFIRILFFRPKLNSYSYFSGDFRLKIFLYYSQMTFPF